MLEGKIPEGKEVGGEQRIGLELPINLQFNSVQSLSRVRLFATP